MSAWRRRICSDWPCTATSEDETSCRTTAGTARPPAKARLRPSLATVRARSSRARPSSTSTSAPASVTRWTALESGVTDHSPSTQACSLPVRTIATSALPPARSANPLRTMVFPAPVSPVMTVRPVEKGIVASAITPSPRIWSRSIIADLPWAKPARSSRCGTPTPSSAAPALHRQGKLGDEAIGEWRVNEACKPDWLR